MLPIFESLLPVFLMIAIGAFLKAIRLINDDQWSGMERISFYVFFPSLLINTLFKADFGEIGASGVALAFAIGLAIILALAFALRRPIEAAFGITSSSYSSVFQGFTRWNAFVSLAIAQKIGGAEAITIVAIGIGVMVIPVNVTNIYAVAQWGYTERTGRNAMLTVLRNPLVVGAIIGMLMNVSGLELYEPLQVTLNLSSQVSLPLGLILVGAGLRFVMPRQALAAAGFATVMKLLIVPLIFVLAGLATGVGGTALVALAISGSVPTAMNGYVIAKDLGGDAPLYAAIATLQTMAAFFTIPVVVASAVYLAG
jgi:predicted permease